LRREWTGILYAGFVLRWWGGCAAAGLFADSKTAPEFFEKWEKNPKQIRAFAEYDRGALRRVRETCVKGPLPAFLALNIFMRGVST